MQQTLLALTAIAALAVAPAIAGIEVQAGKALFERLWIAAPASTTTASGLGPLFNARSCAACHAGGGGARLTRHGDSWRGAGFVLRIGDRQGNPDEQLGRQIQAHALPWTQPEASIEWWPSEDGLKYAIHFGGLAPNSRSIMEMRAAPPLFGRGLVERVSEAAIMAGADPVDRDGDGISGRVNYINGQPGRFGHKASGAGLAAEISEAAFLDLGLSSPSFPAPQGDCTAAQSECLERATFKAEPDLSAEAVALLTAYVASLVPAPPAAAKEGSAIFTAVGCAACHVPVLPDGDGAKLRLYSDLLLHDMGEALAGGMIEGGAAPAEWRTAPLIALAEQAGRRYLHDGRAESLDQAIRWHGGEAQSSRRAFEHLPSRQQQELIQFLSEL